MARNRKPEPGDVCRYTGTSYGMAGMIVKVIGPILDEAEQPTGRYEVQPWLDREGRYSWTTCDATDGELELAPDAPAAAMTRDDPPYAVFVQREDADSGPAADAAGSSTS